MDTIPNELLEETVAGVNLVPGHLRDQLADRPTLLVFLRHFGCIFCREAIAEIRAAAESRENFPAVLFFTQGSVTETKVFLRRYWPTARAVADPPLDLYEAFGVGRASLVQALGPAVIFTARKRAQAKGHETGPRSGDIFRMPGVLLADGGRIVWRYEPQHAADHPDFAAIPELATASA